MKKFANFIVFAIVWAVAFYSLCFIWKFVIVPLWGALVFLSWASNGLLFSFIIGLIIIGMLLAWCSK